MLSLNVGHWVAVIATIAIVWCGSRIARKDRKAVKILLGVLLSFGVFELVVQANPSGIATGSRSLSQWVLTRVGLAQPFVGHLSQ